MNNIDYLHKTVWCTIKQSKVSGVGVFAIRNIPKGTLLTDFTFWKANFFWNFSRKLSISVEDFPKLDKEIQNIILDRYIYHAKWNKKYFHFVSPNKHVVLQMLVNHSDTPNSDGIYALRDITKDEEVTEDFNKVLPKMHTISKKHFFFLKE